MQSQGLSNNFSIGFKATGFFKINKVSYDPHICHSKPYRFRVFFLHFHHREIGETTILTYVAGAVLRASKNDERIFNPPVTTGTTAKNSTNV